VRAIAGLATCFSVALASREASAQQAERVEWKTEWPRFRRAEIAFTAGMSLQVAAALFVYPDPQRTWQGGIPSTATNATTRPR
jgi:hypothetical protein